MLQCDSSVEQSGTEVDQLSVRWSISCRFDGHGQRERGLWVECHMAEFCVKVLKFEIENSRNLFNYFSGIVPRTIKTLHPSYAFSWAV
jgi:hypothetical protein